MKRKTERYSQGRGKLFNSPEFSIELSGAGEIIAEGCLGVLTCSEEQIKLNMGRRTAVITGCDLVIANMFGQTVCIHGRIHSVELI